jgi:hypothetical protein
VGTQPNRTGASATTLNDGRVLIAGGHDDSGAALATALVIQPVTLPPTVMAIAGAFSTPRDGHSVTKLANGDLLACGGGPAGTPSQSCDLIDGTSLQIKTTIMMGYARTNHSAVLLETGQVLIAGGVGPDGNPLGALEIFTPTR